LSKPEVIFIPSSEEGVSLQLLIARPKSAGPYPTVIFNHGSTGRGNNPAMYSRTWSSLIVQKYFNDKGWAVIFPQRRGRGKSGGHYGEGLRADGSGYSCELPVSLAGFERAVQDLDSVMNYLQRSRAVQANQMLIGGASRGGILSIAYAGMRPDYFLGAINFNGGWLGRACPTFESINPLIFERGATFGRDTLWVHGSLDQYYRIAHCRGNFEKFLAAGGRGKFVTAKGGHALLFKPDLWVASLDEYMRKI
jgi:dienelactone hydrolase